VGGGQSNWGGERNLSNISRNKKKKGGKSEMYLQKLGPWRPSVISLSKIKKVTTHFCIGGCDEMVGGGAKRFVGGIRDQKI